MSNGINTDYNDEPVCPYCGHIDAELWDGNAFQGIMDEDEDEDEVEVENSCEECGKDYMVIIHRAPQFSSKKKPAVDDELYNDAVETVLKAQRVTVSLLQRKLGIGYTRGAELIRAMDSEGVIGPHHGSKPREILISLEAWLKSQDATEGQSND